MSWAERVDVLQKVITITAIISAGIWTYFNYFRGRLYKARLEPSLAGRILTCGDKYFMVMTARLKNTGLSKVKIVPNGSGVRLFSYEDSNSIPSRAYTLSEARLGTFSVFEKTEWLEPSESVEEHRLVILPSAPEVALRLELRLASGKERWIISKVIDPRPESESPDKHEEERHGRS